MFLRSEALDPIGTLPSIKAHAERGMLVTGLTLCLSRQNDAGEYVYSRPPNGGATVRHDHVVLDAAIAAGKDDPSTTSLAKSLYDMYPPDLQFWGDFRKISKKCFDIF